MKQNKPLINRAFDGNYVPGSVFKPLVAAAALQEGVIDTNTHMECNHYYTFYAPSYIPTCLGWHGDVDLQKRQLKCLAMFSFYEVGRLLGIDNIDLYAKQFGFGQANRRGNWRKYRYLWQVLNTVPVMEESGSRVT